MNKFSRFVLLVFIVYTACAVLEIALQEWGWAVFFSVAAAFFGTLFVWAGDDR